MLAEGIGAMAGQLAVLSGAACVVGICTDILCGGCRAAGGRPGVGAGHPFMSQAAVGVQADGVVARGLHPFQEGVLLDGALDLLLQVGRGQLQQADGLLQLWGQQQLLALACLKRRLHRGIGSDGKGRASEVLPCFYHRMPGLRAPG